MRKWRITRLIISEGRVRVYTWPLNHCCSVYSCYRVGPAITFRAVYKQMKCMHKQGVGERSEPHSLYIYSRNGSYVPYLFQYRTKSSKDRIAQLARQSSLPWKLQCDRVRGHSIAETLPLSARRTKCSLPVYSTEPAAMSIWCAYTASLTLLVCPSFGFFF